MKETIKRLQCWQTFLEEYNKINTKYDKVTITFLVAKLHENITELINQITKEMAND